MLCYPVTSFYKTKEICPLREISFRNVHRSEEVLLVLLVPLSNVN